MNSSKSRRGTSSHPSKSTSVRWIKELLSSYQKKSNMKRHDSDGTSSISSTSVAPAPQPTTTSVNNNNSNNDNDNNNASRSRQQQKQRKAASLSREQQALQDYVPQYLKPYVYPYHGEFCYTPLFKPQFIAQLMAEGFLPVATRGMLLPKLHLQRSVIQLPHELHVSKSVRKKAKRFSISVNADFERVIQGCHEQHGSHCWLYPPLVQAFREMTAQGKIEATPMNPQTNKPFPDRTWTVRLYTIEVWNVETGALAGGELGYTVGSIYTSLTGFTKEDSAGSVQLVALGRLLIERGFHLWDLGMDMEYKRGIGAKLMPRETFVRQVHAVRETQDHLILPFALPAQNCKDVIDRNQPNNNNTNNHATAETNLQTPPNQKQKQKQANLEQQLKGEQPTATPRPQTHSPPVPETAESPIKKRVRKLNTQG
jgi:Leu/Phe-tRNA-protein transferase